MTYYQDHLTFRTRTADLVRRDALHRRASMPGTTKPSLSRRISVAVFALLQVAIVVLAIELTVSIGYERQPGPVHAPAPANGM